MKEFDWELAKAGRKVCTRDGRPAEVLPESAIGIDKYQYPIIAMVQCEEGVRPFAYRKDGRCYKDKEDGMDLMMVGKVTKYINVYKTRFGDDLWTNQELFETKEKAKRIGTERSLNSNAPFYYCTAEVTWEEEV